MAGRGALTEEAKNAIALRPVARAPGGDQWALVETAHGRDVPERYGSLADLR